MDIILLQEGKITRGGEREVTITIPSKYENDISFDLFSLLAIKNDCILTFYKVELQEILVFNFRAENIEKIDKLIMEFEGLL